MATFLELLKAVLFGIIEGITEWLPISSTGHIILLNKFITLNVSAEFYDLFEIVIQLGAIFAVIVLFFHKLNPLSPKKDPAQKKGTWTLWLKVIVAVLPSAVIGLAFDEAIDAFLRGTPVLSTNMNTVVVAAALILYGIAFLFVESTNAKKEFRIMEVGAIDYKTALLIGVFQCLSIIPGTSRSGSTILGAILLGVARPVGAEFSFFLAIPTMLGASALKVLMYGKDVLDGIAAVPTVSQSSVFTGSFWACWCLGTSSSALYYKNRRIFYEHITSRLQPCQHHPHAGNRHGRLLHSPSRGRRFG